ncbi:MAG: LPXTG cell wall anchor domain-containing protein [Shewanella sp.]
MGTLGVGPDIAVQSATTTNKPTVWDNISNVLTKVVQPAANVYTQIKTNQVKTPGYVPPSGGAYVPVTNQSTPIPMAQPADNSKKYLLIAGVVLLTGTGLYFLTRKKKGLGDLDTAKTKKGKIKQRKAVFAKMDEQGDTWSKNSKGKRVNKKTK